MGDQYVVLCEIRDKDTMYTLAVPLDDVCQVASQHNQDDASISPWRGFSEDTRAPWLLFLRGKEEAKPVWNVFPPQRITKHSVLPVPSLLRNWAQRFHVQGFLWNPPHLIPIVRP